MIYVSTFNCCGEAEPHTHYVAGQNAYSAAVRLRAHLRSQGMVMPADAQFEEIESAPEGATVV
jgi:hypothetical protein